MIPHNSYESPPTTGAQQCQFCGIWLGAITYWIDGKRMCSNCYSVHIEELKKKEKKEKDEQD